MYLMAACNFALKTALPPFWKLNVYLVSYLITSVIIDKFALNWWWHLYDWKISKFNKICPTLWWLIIISCWISYILKCYCSIDYRFLEEIGSYVDSIDRDSVVKGYQKYRRGLNVTHWLYICNMVTVLCHCVKTCHSTWY